MQTEVDEFLVFCFAEPGDEGCGGEGHTQAVGCEPVFGEAEVEERCDGDGGGGELFLLL